MSSDDTDIKVALARIEGNILLVLEKISSQETRVVELARRVTEHDHALDHIKGTVLKWTGAGTLATLLISSGFIYTLFVFLHR